MAELGTAEGAGFLLLGESKEPIFYRIRAFNDNDRIYGIGTVFGPRAALWSARAAGSCRINFGNGAESIVIIRQVQENNANFETSGSLPWSLIADKNSPTRLRTLSDSMREIIALELAKEDPDWGLIEVLTREKVDTQQDRIRFSVDAGHINRLGVELVGKQETALSELIKNAFDADATKVSLDFKNQNRAGGELTISDDGNGMSEEIVRASWMRISTNDKVDNTTSPRFNRTRAGRKGIGRFSVQRLGTSLTLETRPRGAPTGYRAQFDWDDQFTPGKNLQDVFSTLESFEKSPKDHGTTLAIRDLRDAWDESALEKVWRSVVLLQPPFDIPPIANEGSADPGFHVYINGTSREKQQNLFSIEKSFLDQAIANIEAEIFPDGTATVSVKSKRLNLDETQTCEDKFLLTGPLKLSARYFIYLSSALSGMNMNSAADIGRKFGGLRVYRNGFRVLPYGESTDDWLNLDHDVSRRQVLVPANNRNFFGQVLLNSQDNPLFDETSSREGLLENAAFRELQKFSREALEWAAKRIGFARNRKQTAGQRDFKPDPKPKPSSLLRDIRKKVAEANAPAHSLLGQAEAEIKKAEQVAAEYEKSVDADKAESLEYSEMLRLLASLGLSIGVFSHEVKGARDGLAARIMFLQKLANKPASDLTQKQIAEEAEKLSENAGRVFDIGGYIAGLLTSTEARELKTHSVAGAAKRFIDQFSHYMSRQAVTFECLIHSPELRTTEMHSAELDSVFLNFLTNSIKSMNKAKSKNRRIRIDAQREGNLLVIGFEDTGVGIPPENWNKVFEAFYTTTMAADDDGVAGPGAGLGLKIVSDIATSYGGDARVAEPHEGYSCRIEFRVLAAEDAK